MATIKDVAKLAGVGIGTVSRVVSGNGSVSHKTSVKVNNAINILNYKPNYTARSLSSKTFDIIGIWATESSGAFNSTADANTNSPLKIIEHEISRHNKHCILIDGDVNTPNNPNAAIQSFERLISRGCDGILIWGFGLHPKDVIHLEKQFPNIALLNNKINLIKNKCFYYDHYTAGKIAAQHLLKNGHIKIACITGDLKTDDGYARHNGVLDVLKEYGIEMKPEHIIEGDYSFKCGEQGVKNLLNQNSDFSALLCGNDSIAMAAISTLSKEGLSVPNDVSVIGYDDNVVANYTSPPLTTVRVPFNDMALFSTKFLLNQCYGLDLSISYDFPVELIVRESVKNIA